MARQKATALIVNWLSKAFMHASKRCITIANCFSMRSNKQYIERQSVLEERMGQGLCGGGLYGSVKCQTPTVADFQETSGAEVLNFPNMLELAEYCSSTRVFCKKKTWIQENWGSSKKWFSYVTFDPLLLQNSCWRDGTWGHCTPLPHRQLSLTLNSFWR